MPNEPRDPPQQITATPQDPLAWYMEEFLKDYPTEQDWVDALCKFDNPNRHYSCKRCSAHGLERIDARTLQCPNCKTKLRLTAGTFFEGIREPKNWLFTIWLYERRIKINAFRFANFLHASYSATWKMFQKIAMVVDDLIRRPDVDGFELVSSRWFPEVVFRRSTETPAGSHPIAEQDAIDLQLIEETSATAAVSLMQTEAVELQSNENVQFGGNSQLSDTEKLVLESLTEKPEWFDVLYDRLGMEPSQLASTLTILQLSGIVIRLPGERFARVPDIPNHRAENAFDALDSYTTNRVSGAIEFVREVYQGVSRKRLQHYLALFCFFVNEERWPQGALLNACRQADAISDLQVRSYVSPPLVTV